MFFRGLLLTAFGVCSLSLFTDQLPAQNGLRIRHGAPVSVEVKSLYEAGLQYLVKQQNKSGNWPNTQYGAGPGTDGLCCLAIMSSGQDPNYGKYASNIRAALRAIIRKQDKSTGLLAQNAGHGSMYHHGFATLALAEAYGAVDERLLWKGEKEKDPPTLGKSLELAVGCIITSQNQNPHGGWRYSPTAKDADTSVSGANIVALLAARNAGIAIPDENIDKAVKLFENSTGPSGAVAYSVGSGAGFAFGDSLARSSIACLTLSVAKRKDSDAYERTLKHLTERIDQPPNNWKYYTRYYMAQALFQGDFDSWKKWDEMNTEMLTEEQGENGSIGGGPYSTAMSLLSMALNFRFLPIYER